ncbi:hypothetical protein ATCC90586_009405 [Pythium insidiosum]|nr:hypothetical protein ATCC90586_009405 [Pythium insidiosum]
MATRSRARSRAQSGAVVGLSVGTRCYIPDAARVWLPVTVEYVNPAQQTVTLVVDGDDDAEGDARRIELPLADATFPLQNPRALQPSGYADMIELNHLHEAAILDNLTRRFHAQLPYTFTGEICLAVNPYQWLEELYRPELHAQYLKAPSRKRLPPHVYAVSVAAFKHMTRHERNQSILVSGESGAGKTETTKILMDNLAHIGRHGGHNREESSTITRILEVNPLLESFGNAKTKRNDNSSRFGKFTQLQFSRASPTTSVLVGARCETYLLEKSRVVTQEKGERNYHIFYQLLRGCEDVAQRRSLGLPVSPVDATFGYLVDDDAALREKDCKGFAKTKRALALLGLDDTAQRTLFRVLVGVLQLGEVAFSPRPDNEDGSTVLHDSTQAAAELLGLDLAAMEKALCMRTMRAVREVYSVPLNVEQATSSRDALAKALYAKVFDWMVVTINESLSSSSSDDRESLATIGVLDIFGFESFVHNSFEQLCINYANEKLQQKFTQDVFKAVQDEYTSEEITWDHIAYADNADVLALIEGRMGILALLNEEIVRPKGSDESFVGKLAAAMRGPVGGKPAGGAKPSPAPADKKKIVEFPRVSRTQFTIHHYAAAVKYEATGFLEKHKDALLPDLAELMRGSHVPFVCELFPAPEEPAPGPKAKRGGAGADSQTVGTQFKLSLNRLMDSINETNVHYIRCIKPNSEKSPSLVDAPMVVNQLRCAGVIEAISIARAGYPTRMRHSEFVDAFELFLTRESDRQRVRDGTHDSRKLCVALCRDEFRLASPEQFQMGKTKIYLQQGVLEQLEATKAERLFRSAACIQSHWRGLVLRRRFREMVRALVVLQRRMHVAVASRRFQRTRRAVRLVQRVWRGHVARCEFHRRRRERSATRLQCAWRVVVARRRLHQLRRAYEMEQARLRLLREREEAEERRRRQQEADRLRREQERRERLEKERLERERQEKERMERERLERERMERERLARLERERLERERLERERLEHAAVTVQRIARGGLVRQQFAKLQLEEEVLARKRLELEQQQQQSQLPALQIRKSTSQNSSTAREKTAESPEVVAAREENAKLRKQLEELLETNIELETLVSEWKCEREVLKASSHVQQTELKHQISQQRQNIETARNEYATLRAYVEQHSENSRMRMLRRASSAAGTNSSSSSSSNGSARSSRFWRRQPSNSTRVVAPPEAEGGEEDQDEDEDDVFPMDDAGVKEDSSSEEEMRADDDDDDDDGRDDGFTDDRQSANIASFLNRSTFTQRMQNRRGESVRWLRAGAKQLSRAKEMMATQAGGHRTISGRSVGSGGSPPGDGVGSPPRPKKKSARLPFRWKSQAGQNGA